MLIYKLESPSLKHDLLQPLELDYLLNMTKKYIWKPLTCECEVTYTLDSSVNLILGGVNDPQVSTTIKYCKRHQTYDEVVSDNQLLSNVIRDVEKDMPELYDVKLNKKGEVIEKNLKEKYEFLWNFNDKSELSFSILGLEADKQTTLETIVEKYG